MIRPVIGLFRASILGVGLFLVVSTSFCVVALASVDGSSFTPSVPEFTVNLVAYPYDVPSSTTTKIDQYTGEETVIITLATV